MQCWSRLYLRGKFLGFKGIEVLIDASRCNDDPVHTWGERLKGLKFLGLKELEVTYRKAIEIVISDWFD